MELIYHGHSCVQLRTKDGSLVIDPFIRGNELATTRVEDIDTDYVLLTHAHGDHASDAEAISRRNDAPIVSIFELATYLSWKGLQTIDMNIGGSVDLGFAKVKMIQAFHSSSIVVADEQKIIYAGMPAGYIIQSEGYTILHAGDTCLYSDMKMIGERYAPDVAFVPIGDRYTMDPDDALLAAQWLRAKQVVPIHYNTFGAIKQDGKKFAEQLEKYGIQGKALSPGESITL